MTAERTIEALERQLAKAVAACDGQACAALLDDEFTAILAAKGPSFEITLRGQWIAAVGACAERALAVDDVVVSVHGDVAVVTLLITEDVTIGSHQFIVTDVWRRSAADWRLIERHAGGELDASVWAQRDPAV